MPRLDETDHTAILETKYRYARVEAIDRDHDILTVRLLTGSLQPTQTVLQVPAYYHCVPDAVERTNGALEGGSRAFRVDDIAILQVKGNKTEYRAVGIKDQIRGCGRASALFRRKADQAPYDFFTAKSITGKPWSGNVVFSDFQEWGQADWLWFWVQNGPPCYWVLDGGKVYVCSSPYVEKYPRRTNMEQECSGLPSGIITFSIRRHPSSGTYYMLVSHDHPDGEVVDKYQSSNGTDWSWVATVFSDNYVKNTELYGYKSTPGSGVWLPWPPRQPYFIEYIDKNEIPGHPSGYYETYIRLWRIGKHTQWDNYGNLIESDYGYTAWAPNDGMAAWYFDFEHYFEVDGEDIQTLDIVQILRSIY